MEKALGLILVVGLAACSAKSNREGGDDVDGKVSPIIGGTAATDHRDAALINMSNGGKCSGSIIAPRVALTAGHCIISDSYDVLAPYAAYQKAHGSSAVSYDEIEALAGQHDVGLIFLDSDISIENYPPLAWSPADGGTSAVVIGRIQDGTLSETDLFASPAVSLGWVDGWPNDYKVDPVVEKGDSGGPVKLTADGSIVAVNSRLGSLLARVDLVHDWINQQVGAHPGGGDNCGACGQPPSDPLPSCGDLSQAWGLATLCEVNGNGACGGSGQATWDCDACCTPSCGQLVVANGWSGGICDNPGAESEGWCGGAGTQTYDCALCCPG